MISAAVHALVTLTGGVAARERAEEQRVLRNDERWVVFMESGFRWVPAQAPAMLDMKTLGTLLENVVKTSHAVQHLDPKNKDEAVSLDSVTFYPKSRPEFLVLLFSYTNVRGADPGFKNLKTRKNRTEAKKADEAVAASAHLVISLNQKSRKKHSYYPALIEDITGLGKTKMQQAITMMIATQKTFSFKDEDGKTRAANVKFEMTGLDDEQVSEDASAGRLSYFVAIKERKNHPLFDDTLTARITREEVKLKPAKDEIGGSFIETLASIGKVAKRKGYDKVQVHYVRKDGKNRSITFGTHREDAEDFLIKRIDKIELKNTVVAQTHDAPCDELVKAMAGLLRK